MMEHNSVLRPLYEMEGQGAKLLLAGCDEKGRLLYEDLEEKIRRGAKLAVVTHASNVTGNRNDLRRIGKICRETGTLLIVDASQTAGIFPISMKEDNIDVVCFTGPGNRGLVRAERCGDPAVAFRRKRNSYL